MKSDDILIKLGEYFKNESMKEIELIEKEIKDKGLELPEHLDRKLWEITEKHMK